MKSIHLFSGAAFAISNKGRPLGHEISADF
jgi:hypothetical protein